MRQLEPPSALVQAFTASYCEPRQWSRADSSWLPLRESRLHRGHTLSRLYARASSPVHG